MRLGAISCGDEARGCGLAWELNLGNSRGKMIGRTLRFLNFEVKFIEPPEKDHELSCQQEINQHDSPLKPSVCGLALGDCPYVVLEDCPGKLGRGRTRGTWTWELIRTALINHRKPELLPRQARFKWRCPILS